MVSTGGSHLGSADHRLHDLGIQLPAAPTPFGTYVETVQTGSLLFLSGMLPVVDRKPKFIGRLGKELAIHDSFQTPIPGADVTTTHDTPEEWIAAVRAATRSSGGNGGSA